VEDLRKKNKKLTERVKKYKIEIEKLENKQLISKNLSNQEMEKSSKIINQMNKIRSQFVNLSRKFIIATEKIKNFEK
jgi:cytidylate kinase